MRDLFEVVQSTSRMTVFRRLSGVEYLCSYTHAGRYYTLFDIARFDSDGIWFYDIEKKLRIHIDPILKKVH